MVIGYEKPSATVVWRQRLLVSFLLCHIVVSQLVGLYCEQQVRLQCF